MPYRALHLSPMIPSRDLPATLAFLVKALGFEVLRHHPNYAICARNGLSLHLLRAGSDIGQMECYLEVDDLAVVWAQLEPHLEGLRVRAPFVQDYGMRECHLELPHTNCLLFIGQEC